MKFRFTVALAFALSGCAPKQVAIDEEDVRATTAAHLRLVSAWDDCVLHSSRIRFKQSGDRSASVEYGFAACATEEAAYRNRLARGISPAYAPGAIDDHRSKLKQLLVQILPADEVRTLAKAN
jgi:hypothetical protein